MFTTGASVLVIEIVGTRILAPYFGSGIYTWSALIAITLAALALGYKIGGQIADHHPKPSILYGLCAAAGIWTALTFWLASSILPLLVQLEEIRYGILISSFLLFFPNLLLLGTVCPFSIRLLHRGSEEAGSTSGLVFSISTVGSLLGALGTGFLLIPNFGTQAIFNFCGFFLVAFSLLCLIFLQHYKSGVLILIVTAAITYYPATYKITTESTVEIIEQVPSFYGQLQIVRKDSMKMMLVDGIGQNYVSINKRHTTPYINFLSAVPAMHQTNKTSARALVIGLGAGQLPMLLQDNGLRVDVVEIDPLVAEVAKQHFSMALDDQHINFIDGRVFIANSIDTYDYLFIDAFNADQIAWHLLSKEAIEITKNRLELNGVLAINLTSLTDSEDVASIQKTLKSVYSDVSAFAYTPNYDVELTSIIFLASDSPIKLSADRESFTPEHYADISYFIRGVLGNLEGGMVLTDNFNPVGHQREKAQLVWRQDMRDYLGEEKLGWLLF